MWLRKKVDLITLKTFLLWVNNLNSFYILKGKQNVVVVHAIPYETLPKWWQHFMREKNCIKTASLCHFNLSRRMTVLPEVM